VSKLYHDSYLGGISSEETFSDKSACLVAAGIFCPLKKYYKKHKEGEHVKKFIASMGSGFNFPWGQ
jgi:hypothetical protein